MTKRAILCGVLLLAGSFAFADSLDDAQAKSDIAEAKKQGVPVEVVQLEHAKARIAELEKEVADLKAELKNRPPAPIADVASTQTGPATTALAKTAEIDLTAIFNKMPESMRSVAKDTGVKEASKAKDREAWAKANAIGKRVALLVEVSDVKSDGQVNGLAGVELMDGAAVVDACCRPTPASKAKALSLDRGQKVVVTGKLEEIVRMSTDEGVSSYLVISGCVFTAR
jgi:uncharacterized small protein (DUF1192 family)